MEAQATNKSTNKDAVVYRDAPPTGGRKVIGFVTCGGTALTIGGRTVQSLKADASTKLELAPGFTGVLVTLLQRDIYGKDFQRNFFIARESVVIELVP